MLLPMFAMVLLTFAVGVVMFRTRVRSVKSGDLTLGYYRLMRGAEPPNDVVRTERAFRNMFEAPVLFYAAGILCVALEISSLLVLVLAWGYVLFRCIHAWIFLGSNNVIHRMYAFMLSNLCLLLLWGVLVASQL